METRCGNVRLFTQREPNGLAFAISVFRAEELGEKPIGSNSTWKVSISEPPPPTSVMILMIGFRGK